MKDVADEHPDLVEEMRLIMNSRSDSQIDEWNFNANRL